MKVFDLHADIGYDILEQIENGNKEPLKTRHLDKLAKGEVQGVAAASYFVGTENWQRMQDMVRASRTEIEKNRDRVSLILHPDDLCEEKLNMMMSVEGMCGIRDQVSEKIDWLYEQGVRLASLCWNDENSLATGVKGNPLRGLSEKGKEAIRRMNEIGMMIDVSHNNERTFWDILDVSSMPVVATHSNARKLCNVERNLTDQQIRALGMKGGLIGLNGARNFISDDENKRNSLNLARHARHIADLIGSEHVAIGMDFMDFLGDYGDSSMADDLRNASMIQNLVRSLKQVGFSEEEVEMICWKNAVNFMKKIMK